MPHQGTKRCCSKKIILDSFSFIHIDCIGVDLLGKLSLLCKTFLYMSTTLAQKVAHLILADGTIFKGKSFGHIGTTAGEICFNTGMTGYQEVFTDPSYYGQVIIMNAAHIGNYGVKDVDVERQKA
jgi:hypothetical protein